MALPKSNGYSVRCLNHTIGINIESMLDNVRIYPNPATDQLMISINSPEIKDIIIDLVSVTGIIVYHNEFPSMNNPDYSIDIRNYEKGIYFLKIRSIKGQKIEKIVKQ